MSNENLTVFVLTLVWVGIFAATAAKVAKSKIGFKELRIFLAAVVLLALIRTGIWLYLRYRVQSHTFSENTSRLSYALYPDLPLAQLIPTQTEGAYRTVSIVALLLGSFLWVFPLLIVLSPAKKD